MPNNLTFNQNFVPGWNAIYSNLINKVGKTIIKANRYTSPFSAMVQSMEVGEYVEDAHIGIGNALLFDSVTGSDIFTFYKDKLDVCVFEVNVDLTFPSSYREHVVRTGFSILENASELITSLTANIRTTLEYWRNKMVKQMLYNAYQYGMLDSVTINDPKSSAENAAMFAVTLNGLIDDFRTEISKRHIIFNRQNGITEEAKHEVICNDFPYVIVFNDDVRYAEFNNAVNLAWLKDFKSGDSNMDWQNKMIRLNKADFPTSIPPTDRSAVTGTNVPADGINFFEMPIDKTGADLFSGTPSGAANIAAFVLDPEIFKLFTQLDINTAWLNPADLTHTNREIYRGIMQLGGFNKGCVVTYA